MEYYHYYRVPCLHTEALTTASPLLLLSSQKYAWGKPGDQSVVASLKAAGDTNYKVDADEPYAEMWIGTHPSGPSNLLTNSGNVGPLLKVTLALAKPPSLLIQRCVLAVQRCRTFF